MIIFLEIFLKLPLTMFLRDFFLLLRKMAIFAKKKITGMTTFSKEKEKEGKKNSHKKKKEKTEKEKRKKNCTKKKPKENKKKEGENKSSLEEITEMKRNNKE